MVTKKEDKKEKFLRIFANIPEELRGKDIIAVVDDKPFTWNAAAIAIKNDSESGKTILDLLEKLGLI